MFNLFLTLLVAILGGYLADKKKIPAGYMIGALFAVALFNILSGMAHIPKEFRFGTQVATGTFLGAKFFARDLKALKRVFFPGMVMTALMISFSFVLSYVMAHVFHMDYVTAVFASSPGGILDISLIAYEFEANTSQVALLQLIRLISVISFVPLFTKKCCKFYKKSIRLEEKREQAERNPEKELEKRETPLLHLGISLIIGTLGGGFGYFLKIPAGAMSCSMLAVAFYNVKTEQAYMPLPLRKIIQAVGGGLIGSRVTMEDVLGLKELFFPILVIVFGFALMNVLVGFFLYRTTKFSLPTSLLSAAPGGMSDIAIIAGDLGANGPQVAMMQFLRASSIVGVYPIIIKLLFA